MCACCFILMIISVVSGVSQVSSVPARTAHAPYILLSIRTTSGDLGAWIKMLIVSGRWSLVTGWNWLLWKCAHAGTAWTRQKGLLARLGFGSTLARLQHGNEEIYFGHGARAEELRRRVGNGVDDGQRWASMWGTDRDRSEPSVRGSCSSFAWSVPHVTHTSSASLWRCFRDEKMKYNLKNRPVNCRPATTGIPD